MSLEDLLTVKDVAELTGMSEYTIRKKLREGEIEGELSSDREGYRVSRESLAKYLQKAKKPLPAGLFSGSSAGFAAGISGSGAGFTSGGLGLGVSSGGLGFLGTLLELLLEVSGIASLLENSTKAMQSKNENSEKILDLSTGSLEDQIEAIRYSIQALELKEGELSVEDKQKILAGKAQIKLLERQIKELKLQYEINQN